MVSGFLISPYDQDRIFSGLAIEIRIWSKTCAGTCGLKRFIISWFICFSLAAGRPQSHLCHRRACPGDPAWKALCPPYRDGRDKPGHDGQCGAALRPALRLFCRFRALAGALLLLLRIVQVDVETERTHL